jgi:hypothetical protein
MSHLIPGQLTGRTVTPRDCLFSLKNITYGRGVFDATKAYNGADVGYESRMWPGTPLARVAASTLWVPCKRSAVPTGGGTTSATVPVTDARFFRAGDTGLTVGTNTGKTILSVNYSANTITLTGSITFSDADAVHMTDGSELARIILNEDIDLYEKFDRQWHNKQFGQALITGTVDPRVVWGDLTAMRNATNDFKVTFADDVGQI